MVEALRRAVFLDRDGVINRSILRDGKPYAPRALSEFELLPQVEEATRRLSDAGFSLFVVTNQPDLGNKLISEAVVEKMHQLLLSKMPIEKIYMCPHRQAAGCECRKPKPGLLLAAAREFSIDMSASFMIGDRYSDICAAAAAGCTPIFIDYDYIETPDFDATMRFDNLFQASLYIVERYAS